MYPRIPEVTLFEEIGRGQGSVVFRAMHHGKGCTVKLPSDRPQSPTAGTRGFEQDVLQLARLRSTGLPKVLQLGETADTPYAVLAPAEGRPLEVGKGRIVREGSAERREEQEKVRRDFVETHGHDPFSTLIP